MFGGLQRSGLGCDGEVMEARPGGRIASSIGTRLLLSSCSDHPTCVRQAWDGISTCLALLQPLDFGIRPPVVTATVLQLLQNSPSNIALCGTWSLLTSLNFKAATAFTDNQEKVFK